MLDGRPDLWGSADVLDRFGERENALFRLDVTQPVPVAGPR